MAPRRYSDGVVNRGADHPHHQLPEMSPTKVHLEFYDFDTYVAGDWTVTEGDAAATQALTAGDGGALLLTSENSDDSPSYLQKPIINFYLVSGKKSWFGIRFQSNEAQENDFVAGLTAIDTDPVTSVVDGVYFLCDDGDELVDFYVVNTSVTQASYIDLGTDLADNTYIDLEWYFDGVDDFFIYQNGIFTKKVTTANFPTAGMSINFGFQTGAAAAKTMTIDWVYAAKER